MDAKVLASRFAGTILGYAVGDALGMPAEFLSRDQIRRYYGKPLTGFVKAHPGHANDFLPPGSYTDDTQMLLATAECMVECGKADAARQAEALLGWYLNSVPHRAPMRANMRACKRLATGRAWTKSGVFSSGCGAAMRMPPLGLLLFYDPDSLVHSAFELCSITHTDPRARAASVAVAYLIARLVQATDRCNAGDQIIETADRVAAVDGDMAAMLRWVSQITHLPAEEALFEIGTSSDALEAIPAAVYCFLKHPRNYSGAVMAAVNAGDASGSIAALAGSMVGAYTGVEAIPKQWQEEVENADVLTGVAGNLLDLVCRKLQIPGRYCDADGSASGDIHSDSSSREQDTSPKNSKTASNHPRP